MTVEVSLEFGNTAKRAVLDELGEGDEVGVKAAVYFNMLVGVQRWQIEWVGGGVAR